MKTLNTKKENTKKVLSTYSHIRLVKPAAKSVLTKMTGLSCMPAGKDVP